MCAKVLTVVDGLTTLDKKNVTNRRLEYGSLCQRLARPRLQNGTSWFYFATDQWKYEESNVDKLKSPLANNIINTGDL